MAQKTSWTGGGISESDINTYLTHTGGALDTWTPTVTQSFAVAATVNYAVWWRAGRLIHAQCLLTCTGSGATSNDIVIGGLPVTGASAMSSFSLVIGTGHVIDSSAGLSYWGPAVSFSGTTCRIKAASGAGSTAYLGGTTFTAALTTGDNILLDLRYEAAT